MSKGYYLPYAPIEPFQVLPDGKISFDKNELAYLKTGLVKLVNIYNYALSQNLINPSQLMNQQNINSVNQYSNQLMNYINRLNMNQLSGTDKVNFKDSMSQIVNSITSRKPVQLTDPQVNSILTFFVAGINNIAPKLEQIIQTRLQVSQITMNDLYNSINSAKLSIINSTTTLPTQLKKIFDDWKKRNNIHIDEGTKMAIIDDLENYFKSTTAISESKTQPIQKPTQNDNSILKNEIKNELLQGIFTPMDHEEAMYWLQDVLSPYQAIEFSNLQRIIGKYNFRPSYISQGAIDRYISLLNQIMISMGMQHVPIDEKVAFVTQFSRVENSIQENMATIPTGTAAISLSNLSAPGTTQFNPQFTPQMPTLQTVQPLISSQSQLALNQFQQQASTASAYASPVGQSGSDFDF